MARGIQLDLYVGPAVPIKVPRVVIDALQSVQVTVSTERASGFELRFTLDRDSPLHTLFLLTSGGGAIPMVRVVIAVTVGGTTEVLMDGVMTNHQVSPGQNPGEWTLTVLGDDLTRVMDYLDLSGIPYPALPPFARVALMLAKYAPLGILPVVIPSVLLDVPIPTSRIPSQKGKDLGYIQQLAAEVGYVFYIEPGPVPGVSKAYWGPEFKVGVPQPALNVDMDAHRNVESLDFSYESEKATLPYLYIQEPNTKAPIPIPIPDVTPLNPPLGAIPPIPKNFPKICVGAKYSPVQAALIGLAKAAQRNEVVSARGSLDVLRYGRVLRARRLVGVRGAGLAFDGLYYVRGVTHRIQRGEYKQDFQLSRNGLISTLSKVPA